MFQMKELNHQAKAMTIEYMKFSYYSNIIEDVDMPRPHLYEPEKMYSPGA